MTTIVLVCGGRDYHNQEHVDEVLDAMDAHYGELIIMHGGATGADTGAERWAFHKGRHNVPIRALWRTNGKAAGPIRNSVMLKLRPNICIGFPGGKGTADMLAKARAAGIETYEV